MKRFNITGTCIPEKNYMVDISEKLEQIICMIEENEYFTINCARQCGKTTTLFLLNRKLKNDYLIIRLSFEGISSESFQSGESFVQMFTELVGERLKKTNCPVSLLTEWVNLSLFQEIKNKDAFHYLSTKISSLCENSEKEIILMIDEVDKSSNNQVFLDFLGMLRNKYLMTKEGEDCTFKSVILAGVYDIKNLKIKIRPDAEQKYNSPWNIAVDFTVDMNFSVNEISTMLLDYENEHHTGMNIQKISEELYRCTSGYPFLVSKLCKWIDEKGQKNWTLENLENAQKELLRTKNTLFDDLIKNVENHPEIKDLIIHLLYDGMEIGFNKANPYIETGVMFGIFKEKKNMLTISNRIFETYLYDYTISMKEIEADFKYTNTPKFIKNNKLDFPLILVHFQELMKAEYRSEDGNFLERQGRLLFLCFLKPIINGTGFYYIESETRNNTRMDIVVNYGGEEHIIELKIWHGDAYRKDGIHQLEKYMENRNAEYGYLVSFSFSKKKQYTNGWLEQSETKKKIFEVII